MGFSRDSVVGVDPAVNGRTWAVDVKLPLPYFLRRRNMIRAQGYDIQVNVRGITA